MQAMLVFAAMNQKEWRPDSGRPVGHLINSISYLEYDKKHKELCRQNSNILEDQIRMTSPNYQDLLK